MPQILKCIFKSLFETEMAQTPLTYMYHQIYIDATEMIQLLNAFITVLKTVLYVWSEGKEEKWHL